MIPVTKPFMPPRAEYEKYLQGIWKREFLTNNGPLVQELEQKLKDYLDVEHLLYLSNGTIALQIAIKALGLKGEIITTPFSYVATTSSIVWEGCEPVFVDIDPKTLNINPDLIGNAITDKTTGILATHVFGNPCDIDAIQQIADKNNLNVIYDAAHCFGTTYKGKSVFDYGDVSTTSFHATKLFHTVEGGAVFTRIKEVEHRLSYMRNFGHKGPTDFHGIGINGKNSEMHAAMGLCNLKYIDEIIAKRKKQCEYYDDLLKSNNQLGFIKIDQNTTWNYSYYPVIFDSVEQSEKIKQLLEEQSIYPRRYFYPSLNHLPYTNGDTPVSESVSQRILCLPLFYDLERSVQELITSNITSGLVNV